MRDDLQCPFTTETDEVEYQDLIQNNSSFQNLANEVHKLPNNSTSGDVGYTEKQIRYWVKLPSLKSQYNDKNIITSGQWLSDS